MPRLILALLCVAAVAQAALADIAPDPVTSAQSLTPREPDKATPVSMDAERVQVTLTENNAHVKAAFWMRNTSKSPTTLAVGFPDQDHLFAEKTGKSIANLKVTVDGVGQQYEFVDPTRQPDGRYSTKGGQDWTAWHVWQMTFQGEQKRLVVVEYDCQTYRGDGDAPAWTEAKQRDLDMYEGRLPETEEFKKRQPDPRKPGPQRHQIIGGLKAQRDREFRYVLATGAGWHGPIGKGLIEVTLADAAANCIESLNPRGASWQGNMITWRFEDLEPTKEHDIRIGYRQGSYYQLGLRPGLDSILAVLRNRSHKDWSAVAELAKRIGAVECYTALGLPKEAATARESH
jgi:hypothetical protein